MSRAFWTILLTGVFLLLLSALVVTPQSDLPASAAQIPADLHAVFMPATLPPSADAAGDLLRQPDWRLLLSVVFALTAFMLPNISVRDANGRIITAVRYENSVYQLFRPEVAGG